MGVALDVWEVVVLFWGVAVAVFCSAVLGGCVPELEGTLGWQEWPALLARVRRVDIDIRA